MRCRSAIRANNRPLLDGQSATQMSKTPNWSFHPVSLQDRACHYSKSPMACGNEGFLFPCLLLLVGIHQLLLTSATWLDEQKEPAVGRKRRSRTQPGPVSLLKKRSATKRTRGEWSQGGLKLPVFSLQLARQVYEALERWKPSEAEGRG